MTTLPYIPTGAEAGLDDRTYIRRLREMIKDTPRQADEQGSGLGNALRYNVQTVPINDDDFFQVVVSGVTQQVTQTPFPSGAQVFVDFDTGRMIFGNPPAAVANNINVYKNTVRWRDSTMKDALMDGARMMWPKLGKIATDESLTITTLVWDYTLPAVFNDPNVRLVNVAIREVPQGTERFRPISSWERIGNTTLRLPTSQGFTSGATVQLMYEAPYASLSEVEPKAQMLPLFWAAGTLLGFSETKRSQVDTQNVMSETQANALGAQQNAGKFFFNQFNAMLSQMARVRTAMQPETTYNR